ADNRKLADRVDTRPADAARGAGGAGRRHDERRDGVAEHAAAAVAGGAKPEGGAVLEHEVSRAPSKTGGHAAPVDEEADQPRARPSGTCERGLARVVPKDSQRAREEVTAVVAESTLVPPARHGDRKASRIKAVGSGSFLTRRGEGCRSRCHLVLPDAEGVARAG